MFHTNTIKKMKNKHSSNQMVSDNFNPNEYISTINALLKISDIDSITARKIRNSIEDVLGIDLSPYKKALDKVIVKCFLKYQKQHEKGKKHREIETENENENEKNSYSDSSNKSESEFEIENEEIPSEKSSKRSLEISKKIDALEKKNKRLKRKSSDHQLALDINNELNGQNIKNKLRKKSSSKKRKSTSIDLNSNEDKKPRKINQNNPFNAIYVLSPALAKLVKSPEMSRPQVVKAIWQHIKANDLQIPEDRRKIKCDAIMKDVFGDSTDMFTMNKIISDHIWKKDDLVES